MASETPDDQLSPVDEPPRRIRPVAHVVALVMMAISLWMLVGFVGQVITSARLEQRSAELKAELAQIEATNMALKDQLAYAQSPEYAEQQAREQLGYAREGDVIILPTFPDTTPILPTAPTTEAIPVPTPRSNWRAWVQALTPDSR